MNAHDQKRLLDLIEALSLAYPEATFGWRGAMERVMDLWAMALGDLPMPAIEEAVRRWIATQSKLPHISDIRGVITEAVNPLPSEGDAWKEGLAWVRNGTWPGDPELHPFGVVVMKAINPNRRELGQMELDDLRKDFGFAFRRMAGEERTERTAHVGELAAGGLRAIS